MLLPRLLNVLGYAGLIPFLAGPAWLTFSPETVPPWLDHAWMQYAGMIAAFMAGSFWGLALLASEGPAGLLGLVIATGLAGLAWMAMVLPFHEELYALIFVFMAQLLAEFWRERVLDPMSGYFVMRITLTLGVLGSIVWRLMLRPL